VIGVVLLLPVAIAVDLARGANVLVKRVSMIFRE
jgi:hypothetical protein